ncbi:MAG: hypothetical protein FJZ10_04715 [Candidatus Omnitrophica bacterium]|nr:hypothetical protein [Candidatus Omnitrophota bacterium]
MKKIILGVLIITGLLIGLAVPSYASDWDKAGKVFAILEGARVLTLGKVDIIGTITGINRYQEREGRREYASARHSRNYGQSKKYCTIERRTEKVWVPHYVWVKKYVPAHTEYRDGKKIFVEGHYVKYEVEDGGHWEYREIDQYCSRDHR